MSKQIINKVTNQGWLSKQWMSIFPAGYLNSLKDDADNAIDNENLKKNWNFNTVKLGYNEQLGTGHFCSL